MDGVAGPKRLATLGSSAAPSVSAPQAPCVVIESEFVWKKFYDVELKSGDCMAREVTLEKLKERFPEGASTEKDGERLRWKRKCKALAFEARLHTDFQRWRLLVARHR